MLKHQVDTIKEIITKGNLSVIGHKYSPGDIFKIHSFDDRLVFITLGVRKFNLKIV